MLRYLLITEECVKLTWVASLVAVGWWRLYLFDLISIQAQIKWNAPGFCYKFSQIYLNLRNVSVSNMILISTSLSLFIEERVQVNYDSILFINLIKVCLCMVCNLSSVIMKLCMVRMMSSAWLNFEVEVQVKAQGQG